MLISNYFIKHIKYLKLDNISPATEKLVIHTKPLEIKDHIVSFIRSKPEQTKLQGSLPNQMIFLAYDNESLFYWSVSSDTITILKHRARY